MIGQLTRLGPQHMTSFRPKRESERTCVGCRRRALTDALARVALRDGSLVFWGPGRVRPAGRGASLHPDAGCLRAALKAGAFARAFRGQLTGGGQSGLGTQHEADFLQQLTAAAAASRSTNAARGKDRKSP